MGCFGQTKKAWQDSINTDRKKNAVLVGEYQRG